MQTKLASVILFFATSALATRHAHADSATTPPCVTKGDACTAYRTARSFPGICSDGVCWSCDGTHAVTYRCLQCELPEEVGTAGAEDHPLDFPPTCSASDSGCSVQHLGAEKSIAIALVAIGLTALGLARRRR